MKTLTQYDLNRGSFINNSQLWQIYASYQSMYAVHYALQAHPIIIDMAYDIERNTHHSAYIKKSYVKLQGFSDAVNRMNFENLQQIANSKLL